MRLPLPSFPAFRASWALALAAMAASAAETPPGKSPRADDAPLARAARALDAGDIARAESLYALPGDDPGARHRREILGARLAASRGDWRGVDAALTAWNGSPARLEGTGEVLFWLGWSALHQARGARADSLFVLASAYQDDERSRDALEYRYAALLDNGPALQSYLRGLPESPLPHSLRLASLAQVASPSSLYPYARWHLALLHEARGDTTLSRPLLDTLARQGRGIAARRASLYLGLLRERHAPDTALAIYEALLVRNQQGAAAETARKRAQNLRKKLRPDR